MKGIITWLIDSSIIASFIIIIILVMRPFIKKLPKWVNLVLWMIVAVRLVMPVGLESSFSLVPDIDGLRSEYSEILFGDNKINSDKVYFGSEDYITYNQNRENLENDGTVTQKNTEIIAGGMINHVGTSLNLSEQSDKADGVDGVTDTEIADSTNRINSGSQNTDLTMEYQGKSTVNDEDPKETIYDLSSKSGNGLSAVDIISIIWIGGCSAAFIYLLISIFRLRRTTRFSVPAELPFRITKQSLAFIYVCEGIRSPFITGMVGTKLYIPEGMDETTLEYVIKHENAHIRHYDQLWKVIGYILLMIYWFNPFAWVAFICFTKDLELACDERAVGNLSAEERAGYSEALLECSVHNKILSVCPVAFGETGVKTRVKAVISMKKPLKIVIVCLAGACAIFAVCFLTNPTSAKEKADDKELVDLNVEGLNDQQDEEIEDIRKEIEQSDNNTELLNDNEKQDLDEQSIAEQNTDDQNVNKHCASYQEEDNQNPDAEVSNTNVKVDANVTDNADITDDENAVDDANTSDKINVTDNVNITNNANVTGNDSAEIISTSENELLPDVDEASDEINPDATVTSDQQAVIPYGITKIKESAFKETETIRSVLIPDTVESIGSAAFYRCKNLESMLLPSSVTSIGAEAFRECAFKNVIIPDSVTDIGMSAFCENRKLEYCRVSKNLTVLPDWVFWFNENLKKVDLGSRLTKIGEGAFCKCTSLEQVNIPDSVTEIDHSAFVDTAIKEIRIPEGVEVIKWGTFQECRNLEKVYLPKSLKTIEGYAFNKCENLKEIYLPETVETIGEYAFANCSSLREINIPDSVKTIDKQAFWQTTGLSDESKAAIKAVNKKVKFGNAK